MSSNTYRQEAHNFGRWVPGSRQGQNTRATGITVTDHAFFCDGLTVEPESVTSFPPHGSGHFKTFSIYYAEGQGFWIFMGDVLNPNPNPDDGEVWKPLCFSYPQDYSDLLDNTQNIHDSSAYLTNAGERRALYTQRQDQEWQDIILPNIYHAQTRHSPTGHGGLQGELAIFLGLLALSTEPEWVGRALPSMFVDGTWRILSDSWHIHCEQSQTCAD